MADADLRRLERAASLGDRAAGDRLLLARTRAGMVTRPELVAPAIARGAEAVTCSVALRAGTAYLLLPVPCSRITPFPDGSPGVTYDFQLGTDHPYAGLTIEAAVFHDARGRVLSWKQIPNPLFLSASYEVRFTWLLNAPA